MMFAAGHDLVATPVALTSVGTDRIGAPPPRPASWTGSVPPRWLDDVRERIRRAYALRPDWDGYGAGPIRRDVLSYALHLLETIMAHDTPAPHITPMSHEGVLLEWHEADVDLEVEIEFPGEAWVRFARPSLDQDDEWRVGADLRRLGEAAGTLTGVTRHS